MNPFTDLNVLILAGGLGSRLRSVVSDVPKPLAPINGKPYLTYLLHYLSRFGIRRAMISTGYMAEKIEQGLGKHCEGIDLIYSREEYPLGTGGAVALALKKIHNSHIMIMNGDSFVCFDPVKLYIDFLMNDPEQNGVILGANVKDASRYGALDIAPNGCLEGFQEKGNTNVGMINAGVYLFSTRMLNTTLPETSVFSLEKDYFPNLIAERRLFVSGTECELLDIGLPVSLAYAQHFFDKIEKDIKC